MNSTKKQLGKILVGMGIGVCIGAIAGAITGYFDLPIAATVGIVSLIPGIIYIIFTSRQSKHQKPPEAG